MSRLYDDALSTPFCANSLTSQSPPLHPFPSFPIPSSHPSTYTCCDTENLLRDGSWGRVEGVEGVLDGSVGLELLGCVVELDNVCGVWMLVGLESCRVK